MNKVMLSQLIASLELQIIEELIWDCYRNKCNVLSFLTKEEVDIIIIRIKNEANILFELQIKRFFADDKIEFGRQKTIKTQLANFTQSAISSKETFGTPNELTKRFNLYDYFYEGQLQQFHIKPK